MKRIVLFIFWMIAHTLEASSLEKFHNESTATRYEAISDPLYHAAKECFVMLFKTATMDKGCQKRLGMTVERQEEYVVVREREPKGRGFFVFSSQPHRRHLLSMPHGKDDMYTGNIGLKLLQEHPFRAGAWNSVSRKVMDSAHEQMTLFGAFHEAYATVFAYEAMYQIHGFVAEKRKDHSAQMSDMILSYGRSMDRSRLINLSVCMKSFGIKAAIYGVDVYELGALTNAQMTLLQNKGYQRFVHIENSLPMRMKLYKNKTIRNQFAECLLR